MIKLMIVDDEAMTRNGLLKMIPWKELGIDSVDKAEDGAEALELALQIHPDIVLCDIKMPKMNGIELASHLKEKLPHCKVIFLSGYTDKEYLKSAIHLNAIGYIEKPIQLEEVKAAVTNAVSLYWEEEKKRRLESDLMRHLEDSIVLAREKLAQELTNHKNDKAYLKELAAFSRLQLSEEGSCITVILQVSQHQPSTLQDQQYYLKSVAGVVDEELSKESLEYISYVKENHHIILHILNMSQVRLPAIKNILSRIHSKITAAHGDPLHLFIGAGEAVSGWLNIGKSYQTAVIALQKYFFFNNTCISIYDEKQSEAYTFSAPLEATFSQYLKEDKREEALAFIHDITDDIRQHDSTFVSQVKNFYFTLLLSLFNVSNERNITTDALSKERDQLWDSIMNLHTLSELEAYTLDKITTFFHILSQKDNKSYVVFRMIRFVEANYSDKNLSITMIADYLHLTPTYPCTLFKNEMGKTINQYITETRIEKAKELLKDRKVKLAEIADMVGYGDVKYFTKIFKKVTGMNPSDFREKYLL